MHMTLSNDSIEVVNVQHNGVEGFRVVVPPRPCVRCSPDDVSHNLQVYREGVQRRGVAGALGFSSSTQTTTSTRTTRTGTSGTTSRTTITTTATLTSITTTAHTITSQTPDSLAARKVQRAVTWISDTVADVEKSGRNASDRTAQEVGTAIVSTASETAQWVGREMTGGEKKAVNVTGVRRELLRGAVGSVMSSPYGAAILGAAAALVAALVLLLRGGTAHSAGVAHHDRLDSLDSRQELLDSTLEVRTPRLAEGHAAPPAEEDYDTDDDRVWNPP
jgi:hypothetical protein